MGIIAYLKNLFRNPSLNYSLGKSLAIGSKEFKIWSKPDEIHGAMIKIEETEISRRAHGYRLRHSAKIDAITLDAAIELCERLEQMEDDKSKFTQSNPLLPRRAQFAYEIAEPESTYQLDFRITDYDECLRITQNKPRWTLDKQSDTITIPDVSYSNFRQELSEIVNELSNNHLTSTIESDKGINKVIRGNRVAVIVNSIRPWPWNFSAAFPPELLSVPSCTFSYPDFPEQQLFDPNLVDLILFDRDVNKIHDYITRSYPGGSSDDQHRRDQQNRDYENLRVKWVRRGVKFQIPSDVLHHAGTGSVFFKSLHHWVTA